METVFRLTVRTEDFRGIYPDIQDLQKFKEYHPSAASFQNILVVLLISCLGFFFETGYLITILVGTVGFGYLMIQSKITKANFHKRKIEIEDWIEKVKNYKTHSVKLTNSMLKYQRDEETFVYDLQKVKNAHLEDEFFHFALDDGENMLFPKKSFDPGKFEEFVIAFERARSIV